MIRVLLHRLVAFAGLAVLWLGPAMASPQPRAVLEFFVSQGCSACPPANKIASELARDPELIILTLPVAYWDYRGWKDTLAVPFTITRQKGYAAGHEKRVVFTPQTIINGSESCTGSSRPAIDAAMRRALAGQPALPVDLDLSEDQGRLTIDVSEGAGNGEVLVLPITRSVAVEIRGGDNAGTTETYVNVVRDVRPIGVWLGSSRRFSVALKDLRVRGADAYVVILQRTREGYPGTIIGAVQLPASGR